MTDNELYGTLEESSTDEVRRTLAESAPTDASVTVVDEKTRSKKAKVALRAVDNLLPCSPEWRPAKRQISIGAVMHLNPLSMAREIMRTLVQSVPEDRQAVFASVESPSPERRLKKSGAKIVRHEEHGLDPETWLRRNGAPVPAQEDVLEAAEELGMTDVLCL